MSKLKDAVGAQIEALEKLAPAAQAVVDEFMTRWGVAIRNSQNVRLVDYAPQSTGNYHERMNNSRKALEMCEENEERILELESRGASRVMDAIDRLERNVEKLNTARRAVPAVLAQAEDAADANEFAGAIFNNDDLWLSFEYRANLMIERAIEVDEEPSALEKFGGTPEDIVREFIDNGGSYALDETAAAFCEAFDFEPSIDGSPIENLEMLLPDKGDPDNPHYIGGTFTEPGRVNHDRCEPLYSAFVEATETLPYEFQDGVGALKGELSDDEIRESEAYYELKDSIGKRTCSAIDEAVDWAQSTYPKYCNRMIESVRGKQEEYDLGDDLVNEFESLARANVSALLDNVNEFFNAETLLGEDEANSVFFMP